MVKELENATVWLVDADEHGKLLVLRLQDFSDGAEYVVRNRAIETRRGFIKEEDRVGRNKFLRDVKIRLYGMYVYISESKMTSVSNGKKRN